MATLQSVAKHPAVEAGCASATRITVWSCRCKKCGKKWETLGDEIPDYCPGCRKEEWWIKRPRGRPLKVRADIWVGRGPVLAQPTETNTVQWEVTDSETGKTWLLRRVHLGPKWQILRRGPNGRSWKLDETEYPDKAAALEVIESECEESILTNEPK
jgi:hypothetical protein